IRLAKRRDHRRRKRAGARGHVGVGEDEHVHRKAPRGFRIATASRGNVVAGALVDKTSFPWEDALETKPFQTWELWYPEAAATGLPFARARIDPTNVLWAHAAPDMLAVTVREGDGRGIARGDSLRRSGAQLPMTRLALGGDGVTREDQIGLAA